MRAIQAALPLQKANDLNNLKDATPADFQQVLEIVDHQSLSQSLNQLADLFRQKKLFAQWFETLKMIARQELGLSPLKNPRTEERLDLTTEMQLENRLLDACCEVGLVLWQEGHWEQGWSFLQPVANRRPVVESLRQIEVDSENVDFVIHVALAEGVDPVSGYRRLLEKYGTCDGITTYDTQAARFDHGVQAEMASLLLNRLYQELCQNIQAVAPQGLPSLLEQWESSGECGLFIDATHLASVVRIARLCQQPSDWQHALLLCRYGLLLPSDLQYPSPPPFENTFEDHQFFFQALLGTEVDLAIRRMTEKCQRGYPDENQQQVADEILIDFLVRLDRREAAIEVFAQQILGQRIPLGIAPAINELAQTRDELIKLRDCFRQRDDLLGFAICQLLQNETEEA